MDLVTTLLIHNVVCCHSASETLQKKPPGPYLLFIGVYKGSICVKGVSECSAIVNVRLYETVPQKGTNNDHQQKTYKTYGKL